MVRQTLILITLLAAGCADTGNSGSGSKTGTLGTASQMGSSNQLGDSSQVNVNRVNTVPQDGENASVGGANGQTVQPVHQK
jgi:hypothetical protein